MNRDPIDSLHCENSEQPTECAPESHGATRPHNPIENYAAGGRFEIDAQTYAKLSKLSGAEFDKAYANEMVQDHEKDVAEFQKEVISGKDPR